MSEMNKMFKPTIEAGKEKPKYGANVYLEIDLIRHPEKDYETGDLTEEGKAALLEKLRNSHDDKFDTHKFYLSPHKRPQQSREKIQEYLDEFDLKTKTRNKEELTGRIMTEFTPEAAKALHQELADKGIYNINEEEETLQKDRLVEPVSKDQEKKGNEYFLKEFYDKNLPDFHMSGKDIAAEIEKVVKHFVSMTSRLKSDSKVKLTMIGHSGIVEYFTKLVYLQNHPELKPSEVTAEMLGGLLNYSEGPSITIQTDEMGEEDVKIKFKDLVLDYKVPAENS